MKDLFHVFWWRRPMHVHLLGRCVTRRFSSPNRKALLPTPWIAPKVAAVHMRVRP